MDKTGIAALIVGIVLLVIGAYAIWAFLPEVVKAVEGLIGIVVLLAGLMLIIFGILIFKE
jgi:glucan phosphoethanolaminetransferase (alkaline phosphatase superfamily)